MTDPYAAPTSPVSDQLDSSSWHDARQRSLGLLAGYWALTITSIILSVWIVVAIPAFEGVFHSFGVDLPLMTLLVLKCRIGVLFLPCLPLIPAVIYSGKEVLDYQEQRNYLRGFVALLLAMLGIYVSITIAIYLPLFVLGRAV